VFLAKFVRQAISFDAVPRLQRILWVVNAGVNDSAVPRTRGHPELRILLDQKNILPARGNGSRNRAADNASPDDQNIGLVHEFILSGAVTHGH
jgi:hypothetical protein